MVCKHRQKYNTQHTGIGTVEHIHVFSFVYFLPSVFAVCVV